MRRLSMLVLTPFLTAAVAVACADAPLSSPPVTLESEANRAAAGVQAAPSPTLVDVALQVNAETGEFSTLIAAVLATGLEEDLSARGQRTVFAPTDAAFAELGLDAGNVAQALDRETLRTVLLHHVTPGRRDAESVVDSDRLRMASGGFTEITVTGDDAFIDDARIVATDVEATNGIIHVIDAVLLP